MSQSYSNLGGTGQRSSFVICTSDIVTGNGGATFHLTDGDNSTNNANTRIWLNNIAVSGHYIEFDFGVARVVDEAKFYQSATTSHGTWKWQGSSDNFSSDTHDIGSSFTLGGAATQTQTQLNGNATSYRYYRLLGVSGSAVGNAPFIFEFEFQIDTLAKGSQDYANTGGAGDRSASITVTTTQALGGGAITTLVNGNLVESTLFFSNGQAVSGNYIKFDFGSGHQRIITEATWYQSTTASHGTWKWQGSNDDSSYTDIGSSFTLGGATQNTQTQLSGNTTAYRYYRMLGVSGNASSNPWIFETEFKVDDGLAHFAYSASGGLSIAGNAGLAKTKGYLTTGGLSIAGAAATSFGTVGHYVYTASGGMTIAGAATTTFVGDWVKRYTWSRRHFPGGHRDFTYPRPIKT